MVEQEKNEVSLNWAESRFLVSLNFKWSYENIDREITKAMTKPIAPNI